MVQAAISYQTCTELVRSVFPALTFSGFSLITYRPQIPLFGQAREIELSIPKWTSSPWISSSSTVNNLE